MLLSLASGPKREYAAVLRQGHKKTGKSGIRYLKYKTATTVGEYMRLYDERFWPGDFKHDFARVLAPAPIRNPYVDLPG